MVENQTRPNPDVLLAKVKAEEEQKKHGKLVIFLGYAAGVGKTYKMLTAARQRQKNADIAIGYVETHGRVETEALLEGFEIIPRRQTEYRGIKLTEMDLDTVLARHPQIAVVDELAHENPPNSRHNKRYMDIEELLEAGIDVFTTLNIQHIESVRDVVSQITGVWVRETVPDSIIDNAFEIEVVDLPPEQLVERFKEGKVYVPEQIADATTKFFRIGNLTALRELTMRTAAKHVDEQTKAYMKAHAITGPWQSGERLLVCIIPDLAGNKLIRSARRLANELGAEWTALYIETPASVRLSTDQQDQLAGVLSLAERMGGKTAKIQANDTVTAVLDYAKNNNITKIVLPGTTKKQRPWQFYLSPVSRIIRKADEFDVYLVGSGVEKAEKARTAWELTLSEWKNYLYGLGLVILATLLGFPFHYFFTEITIVMLYLLCVVVAAILWGLGPSIVVSILGVIVFDFFFVPPAYSFNVGDTQYLFTLLVLFGVGFTVSYLTNMIRRQTEASRHRERQTEALYALGKDLAIANDLDAYIHAVIHRSKETFGNDAVIYLPDKAGKLQPYTENPVIQIGESEKAAAIWSFERQKIVGNGTDTLPYMKARYLPMVTARGTVGIIAISAPETGNKYTQDQGKMMEAYADLAAVAIESILANAETRSVQLSRNADAN